MLSDYIRVINLYVKIQNKNDTLLMGESKLVMLLSIMQSKNHDDRYMHKAFWDNYRILTWTGMDEGGHLVKVLKEKWSWWSLRDKRRMLGYLHKANFNLIFTRGLTIKQESGIKWCFREQMLPWWWVSLY